VSVETCVRSGESDVELIRFDWQVEWMLSYCIWFRTLLHITCRFAEHLTTVVCICILSESFWTLLSSSRVCARIHFCLCDNSISCRSVFDWQFPYGYILALVKSAFAHLLLSSCRRELIEFFCVEFSDARVCVCQLSSLTSDVTIAAHACSSCRRSVACLRRHAAVSQVVY